MSDAPQNFTPATETSSQQLANGERAEGELAKDQGSKNSQTKAKVTPKQVIDFGDEKVDLDTLKTERSKYKAAEQKFREAAQARKEIESFYEQLQNDPEAVLNDPRLSIKKRELAEKWLMEELKQELNDEPQDPREIELAKIKKELEKYKVQEKQTKEQQEQEEYQALLNSRKEAIATTLSKAMELSPLSKDPVVAAATLKEMAMYMRMTRDAGYEASPEEIAQHIEEKHMSSLSALVSKLDGDDLLSYADRIGLTPKVRKADLARLQKQREQPAPQQADNWQSSSSRPKQREIIDPNDLRRKR